MERLHALHEENKQINLHVEAIERIVQHMKEENTPLDSSAIVFLIKKAEEQKGYLQRQKQRNQEDIVRLASKKERKPIQLMHFVTHRRFSIEHEQEIFQSIRKFQTVPFSYKIDAEEIGFLFSSEELSKKDVETIWDELKEKKVDYDEDVSFLWDNTGNLLEWDGIDITIIKE